MPVNRQPEGIPSGGQYAATIHAEPVTSLVGAKIGQPRELTPEELTITCQAVPGNGALSEATRQAYHARRKLAQAVKELDETMLNATVIHLKQRFPGAKELRMRQPRGDDAKMIPTFLRTGDEKFIGARYDKGPDADWATRWVDGADPGSVTEALQGISAHSDIWDTNARCDYDPQTEEHLIYLDGRRRHES